MTTIRSLCLDNDLLDIMLPLWQKQYIWDFPGYSFIAVSPGNQTMGYSTGRLDIDGAGEIYSQITDLKCTSPVIGEMLVKAMEESAETKELPKMHVVLLSREYTSFFRRLGYKVSMELDRDLGLDPRCIVTKVFTKRTIAAEVESSNTLELLKMIQFGTFRCKALSLPPPSAEATKVPSTRSTPAAAASKLAPRKTTAAKAKKPAEKAEPVAKVMPAAKANPPCTISSTKIEVSCDTAVQKPGPSDAKTKKVENVNGNGGSVEDWCHPKRKKTSRSKSDKSGKIAAFCLNSFSIFEDNAEVELREEDNSTLDTATTNNNSGGVNGLAVPSTSKVNKISNNDMGTRLNSDNGIQQDIANGMSPAKMRALALYVLLPVIIGVCIVISWWL